MQWFFYSTNQYPDSRLISQQIATRVVEIMRETSWIHAYHDFNLDDPNTVDSWGEILVDKTNNLYGPNGNKQFIKIACRYTGEVEDRDAMDVAIIFHRMQQHELWAFSLGFQQENGPLPTPNSPGTDAAYESFVGFGANAGELDSALIDWHLANEPCEDNKLHTVSDVDGQTPNPGPNTHDKIIEVERVALHRNSNWRVLGTNRVPAYGHLPPPPEARRDRWWGTNNEIDIHTIERKF